MPDITIRRYANSFSVASRHLVVHNALSSINSSLTLLPMNRQQSRYNSKYKPKPQKVEEFFIYSVVEDRYYYSNALYETVLNVLDRLKPPRGIGEYSKEVIEHKPIPGEVVEFDRHKLTLVEPEGSPFFFQNEVVDFAMKEGTNHRIFEIQTGRGKTKMAIKTMIRFGQRTLIITKAAYVQKWIGDIKENLNLRSGEMYVPTTGRQLDTILTLGKAGRLNAMDKSDSQVKVIIISSSILDAWIKGWVEEGQDIPATEFVQTLGAGMVIYDESHQLFRKNYWSFMLMNAPKILDLSATLEPDDSDTFICKRYTERFPMDNRYNNLEYNKYIDAFSIYYGIGDTKLRKRINKFPMYNHTEFEKCISSSKEWLDSYFTMIDDIVRLWYVEKREKGEKALVFFATKEMCTKYRDHAQARWPDIKVTRSIEGDNYDEFVSGDLGISTPGKSGTAVDIPGLILSVVTVAISKRQMNLQILGRTRDLRREDKHPRVVFLHSTDVRKHIGYLKKRQRFFEGKVRKFTILNSQYVIGGNTCGKRKR